MAKAVLQSAAADAKRACGTDQLCVGLGFGIQGRIHAMQELWISMAEFLLWGFLLITARNTLN
jgi:hypothetical protein